MDSSHDYRLKNKDKWTKKEFEKIFPHSNLIWPSDNLGIKNSPTYLTCVYVEVKTPYDGTILEGIINKLGRKNLAQFHEAVHVQFLSMEEALLFETFHGEVPNRVLLDLDTSRMSELKEIINDLHNAKDKIQEFTEIKGIGTKNKLFQLRRRTSLTSAGGFYGSEKGILASRYDVGNKLSEIYARKNILSVFEKYIEFVDPEYLTQDLDRVNRLFSAFMLDSIGRRVHDTFEEYRKKKDQENYRMHKNEDSM